MAKWPTDWRAQTLRAAKIPITQFTRDVLAAWQKSVPLEPWTNNPLGLPALRSGYPAVHNTAYAHYPSMTAFYKAFAKLASSKQGRELRQALELGEKKSEAWRAIHGLNTPANRTEQDFPYVLLDMVEQDYRDKVTRRTTQAPKTTGVVQASPQVHEAMMAQSSALYDAARFFDDASAAMRHIIERTG